MPINPGVPRSHRTALVIDVSKASEAKNDFNERVARLLQSVNGPNIKVDVFTFDGSNLRPGAPSASVASTASKADIEAWAKQAGYTQLLVSQPA